MAGHLAGRPVRGAGRGLSWLLLWALAGCAPADDGLAALWVGDDHVADDDEGDDDAPADDDDLPLAGAIGGPGQFTALAVDRFGAAHIIHYALAWLPDDPSQVVGELRYATNGGGGWTRDAVAGDAQPGARTALRIDPQRDHHVSFVQAGRPVYGYRDNVCWELEELHDVGVGSGGGSTSIGLDGDGDVYVGFRAGDELRLAHRADGGWGDERLARVGEGGGGHAMTVDGGGVVHVVYHAAEPAELWYARGRPGAWEHERIVRGDVGREPGLALGPDGAVHVVFRDLAAGRLELATRGDGGWQRQVIGEGLGEGGAGDGGPGDGRGGDERVALALDLDGSLHVAYFVAGGADLGYATDRWGGWSVDAVDSAGDVGRYPSIAVDDDGGVHLAYTAFSSDGRRTALKFATDRSGFWETTRVEDAGDL